MESARLRTAQVHFIDEPVKLIHIPTPSYGKYVQQLLQTLYPLLQEDPPRTSMDDAPPDQTPWMNRHKFLNISITPLECSLFCPKSLATSYFSPIISSASKLPAKGEPLPSISSDDFLAISVEGEGLDAGQRVLELTTPLAMAGISLFFITTYFSDYILVPAKARCKVVQALESRDFTFDHNGSGRGGGTNNGHHRMTSSSSSFDQFSRHVPLSPPPLPTSLSELQARTTALLKKNHIYPVVHRDLRLHQCAASSSSSDSSALQIGLISCLAHPPRFLSVTLTATEAASLLLEESTRRRFEANAEPGQRVLNGGEDVLVPVTLDLAALGEDATGIVCGVAGKLLAREEAKEMGIEMSYLSTARGAAVLVDEEMVERARERLREGEGGLDVA